MVIDLEHIKQAHKKIKNIVQKTPTELSRGCSEWVGSEVYLKFENLQTTGSFKIRGALNRLLGLTEEERKRGVIASSAGNHAQGVAYSSTRIGCRARVVMPENSPLVKVVATQSYGAEVILKGGFYDESYAHARKLGEELGLTFIHPYDDPLVIAGQGTIGLEILDVVHDLDSIVIPIGGGGLISGVATAVKAINPACRVYGVVASNAPTLYHWYQGQRDFQVSIAPTIADGIAVKNPSPGILDNYICKLVDDVTTVSDLEISEALVFLMERAKTVVEGCGAVSLAAAAKMKGRWDLGKKTCVVLSGGNIDLNLISSVIQKGLEKKGRLVRFSVQVFDRPGTLNKLTSVIAESRANVLQVTHDRFSPHLEVTETRIDFLLETRDRAHVQELREAMKAAGAKILEVE